MALNNIIRVVSDQEEIQLMVRCWHCNQTPIVGEDDQFCEFCFNEIESVTLAAWEEYELEKPDVDLYL